MVSDIKNQLQKLLTEIAGGDIQAHLERPADNTHGDWASNIAMVIAGKEKKNPRQVAEDIVAKLKEEIKDFPIESIEIAGPGFINFKLKPEYYTQTLNTIDENYGKQKPEKPLRIIIEMGDPNTHKLPHIGHLFNYISGDAITRLMEISGHQVYRCSWQGDVGPHVAKALYGWRKMGKPDPKDIIERMQTLQDAYVLGNQDYEKDENNKAEIIAINKKIYLQDPEVFGDWKLTKQWSIDFDEYFEARLGIKLQNRYLEGDLWKKGKEYVEKNIGKVFVESQGAIVFPGEKFGLHTRVFLTKEGTPTYETKEIGLNTKKMEDFPYDLTIIPTASEQNAYFQVVIKAIEEAIPELKGKIKHVGTGMISLSTGKMSSRTGNILTGPDLVNTVEERVRETMKDREGLSDSEKEEIIPKITMAAVKYAFLKNNILQNMAFNIEESISFEGNSGPYLQYTYARIQSVLKQTTAKENGELDLSVLNAPEEMSVMKWLERYPETVRLAADTLAPHLIANYTFELAQKFNSFYKQHSIKKAESEELAAARRLLAEKVALVVKSGLNLLGIEAVDTM